MTVYKNQKRDAALNSVELVNAPHGQSAIFYLRDSASADLFKRQLHDSGLGLKTVATTQVSGQTVIVTEGGHLQEALMEWLASQGAQLEISHHQKPMDAWVVRSLLGFGGQTLQLISSFLRPETAATAGKGFLRRVDGSVFVFAAANMVANGINLIYKGHDLADPHQLKFLKEKFNSTLTPHMAAGELAPSTADVRKDLREGTEKPKGGFDGFMREHSVNVGELGLRYLGAFGMAYPPSGWNQVFSGKVPPMNSHPLRRFAGMGSLVGKTVALGSKVEDPYNPKPHDWLDTIREKFTFNTGGLIEATAFGALAYDCFFNTKEGGISADRGIVIGGNRYRDWLGGIGASMFVTGYIVRSWAKYGERNVDMEELYAHVSDTLAKVTPDKLPQLLADTAADIKNHFKNDTALDYGTIYAALVNDLKRYHHIDVAELAGKKSGNQQDRPRSTIDAASAEQGADVAVSASLKVTSGR